MLLKKFLQNNINNFFFTNDKILIAVSGGIDSCTLLDLCKKSKLNFIVAHCNFQLRGKDSDMDEIFIIDFCKKNNITFFTKKFNLNSQSNIQETARTLRYDWFKVLIEQQQCKYLFTAHNADDNIETLLMNFYKGTGIQGLCGIPIKQNNIIRPLLFASRKDIEQYATENNIKYREDISNSETKYLRNKMRNFIIPELEKIFPTLKNNLQNNIKRFNEINIFYQYNINILKKQLFEYDKNDNIKIALKKILKLNGLDTLLFELFKPLGINNTQTTELKKLLLGNTTGKYLLSSSHRFLINRNFLIISPLNNRNSNQIFILESIPQDLIIHDNLKLKFSLEKKINITPHVNEALLNYSKIEFPLIVRQWQEGDYFYPLGLNKKQKLKKFFTNNKFSIRDKENVWIIESNKKIIWIINHRIDNRYKITDTSLIALKIIIV